MSISNGVKANATNFNTAFVSKSTPTTKGDLLVRSSTELIRVGVGTDGQVLTADATEASGVKWANSTGGGGVGTNYVEGGDAETGTNGWVESQRLILGTVNGASDEFFATTSITFVENEALIAAGGIGGLTTGTTYYAKNAAGNTTQFSATPGGAAINISTSSNAFLFSATFRGEYVGSGASTWTASAVTPLRGLQSFLLSKPASLATGDVKRYAFSIDEADQSKILQIRFDHEVSSGTFDSGDLTCFIHDVTNDVVINPTSSIVETLSASVIKRRIVSFQAANNSTSYELILLQPTATALAFDLRFDNIEIGPPIVPFVLGNFPVKWLAQTNAPVYSEANNIGLWQFSNGATQSLYCVYKVPAIYPTGLPLSLRFQWYSAGTSNTVLMQTVSTLIRAGVDLITSTTYQRTSTNAAVTLSASTANEIQVVNADITSSTGQINSVNVSAGDLIIIQLTRGTDTSSDDVNFIAESAEVSET